jgi:threonine/homoserine/homoserine lactone efflux protein
VLLQVAGFALLAAVSPTALLVMAVLLASANPRATAFMYAAGAFVMTVVMAVAVLLLLRAVHLNDARHHDPRFGLRFGLGIMALLICAWLQFRPKRTVSPDGKEAGEGGRAGEGGGAGEGGTEREKKPGFIARMTENPHPRTAFILGLILFAPGATFIAAVQAVATADASIPQTVAALVIVIVLTVITVWLPLLAFLAAPEATTRVLQHANGWLRANSRTLVTAALAVAGLALVTNGAVGLWG